ncbi:MAG TPA: carboxylating nicotinate-nucleotide diphosphorylase, partial [Isosphaeraceae bacterium]|nr:carboxylating nicotinate-nucleotide diphosphorylase [Isosphaeraceae bacterium]
MSRPSDAFLSPLFSTSEQACAEALISLALQEDLGQTGDLTARVTIPEDARGSARFVARRPGRLSGLPVVMMLAQTLPDLELEPLMSDGSILEPGSLIARVSGLMRALLAFERTALNFLQRLSGIATLTARFVEAVAGSDTRILDTRKTTPGWRALEKYAVRCGGGQNHRIGLYDGILIKDNHLAWLKLADDPIRLAIESARSQAPPGTPVEIEVDTLDQLDLALACHPDIILVENF